LKKKQDQSETLHNNKKTKARDKVVVNQTILFSSAESVCIMILNLQVPNEGSLSVIMESPGNLHALSAWSLTW
jgi:hypothetical protein